LFYTLEAVLPRTRRISWLNYPHLVIAQANGGAPLFVDESDYKNYLSILQQMAKERLLKIFAFALLKNEVRLVIAPHRLMLSRIVQRLHGRHTAHMNQKLGRVGHLFRGRFKSVVFNHEDLIEVVRSVHLTPVRQGLVKRPELYPFSSHAYYMGIKNSLSDFISFEEVLQGFVGTLEGRRRAFGRFLEIEAMEKDDLGIKEIVPGIGGQNSKELLEKAKIVIQKRNKTSIKILAERVGLLLNIPLDQLTCQSRRQDLVMARRLLATASVIFAGRSITEVATFLKRDKGQISRLVSQGLDLINNHQAFNQMIDTISAKGAS
jgi:putative transposase